MIKGDLLAGLPEWCNEVPYQIKSIAIRDACLAVKKCKMDTKKTGEFHQAKFRSRKAPVQSLYIPKTAVLTQGVYYTLLGEMRYGEDLPDNFGDARLTCYYGKFYLCLPVMEQRRMGENQARVVALDPGVRRFVTFFSEDSFGFLGDGANKRIEKLCFRLDSIYSQMSKANSRRKKRLHRASLRVRARIMALIQEMHKKIARFLCDNFDVILLPTFETSEMTSKAGRKIRSKTARQMLSLKHFSFKRFLKHKAFELGKIVIDVCEAYTSKTASWTGEIKSIGGSKTITSGGLTVDRDLNGARGIFLRATVDTPLLRNNLRSEYVVNVR